MRVIPSIVWEAVFPRFCVACGREGALLCKTCDEAWAPSPPHKEEWDAGAHDIAALWALLPYADPVARGLLTSWKYHFDTSAWETLQRRLAPAARVFPLTLGMHRVEAIVPLPLSRKRRAERGFDQAVEIASWLSCMTGIPMRPLLSRRHRDGRQAERTDAERKAAMRASPFVLSASQVHDRETMKLSRVLLVDDVWTTGATMDAGARVLKAGGVEEVYGFSLAKGT